MCIPFYWSKFFAKSYKEKKTRAITVAEDMQLGKFHLTLLNLFSLNSIRYIQIM